MQCCMSGHLPLKYHIDLKRIRCNIEWNMISRLIDILIWRYPITLKYVRNELPWTRVL